MSDPDAHQTAPDQAPTDPSPTNDPSPANDLRIDPPNTGTHGTSTHSTDLHNLRGLAPGQDVPAWVAEATRQGTSQQPGQGNAYNQHPNAQNSGTQNSGTQNSYSQNSFPHSPFTQPGGNLGNPYGPAQPSSGPLPLSTTSDVGTKKLVAGLLAIFLGSFGVHKFYLSRTGAGLVMLIVNLGGWFLAGVLTLITFGIAGFVVLPLMSLVAGALGIIGLIEGIVYLTRSDEEFNQTYVVGRKDWF
ncbi:TM2 domain-containing protein [Deinococcus sp.]|uniref:TM2 domain-containing protein n=1 Tax=Deinococcus sp. TaxID=47478 RepID=UPI0025F619DC|nr:TM2 domain-containing protein [Deinococcus sp.]